MFHNADLIIYGIVNNFVSKFNLEDYRIIFFSFLCLIFNLIPKYYKNKAFNKIKTKIWWKPNYIYFEYQEDKNEISHNFKGLLKYINKNSYARETKEIDTSEGRIFQVNQSEDFLVHKEMEIYGNIYMNEREIKSNMETKYSMFTYLTLYSYTTSNKKMVEWIEKLGKENKEKAVNKYKNKQNVFEIYYSKGKYENYKHCYYVDFFTNITFDNTYLPNQDTIKEKIDFFSNNEIFFKERGLKRNLNFLFSGDPGTGKTAMVKAIAKYTKRHIIMLKIDENFCSRELEKIFLGILDHDIKFNLNEIIFVIEEVDLICKYFHKRNLGNVNNKNEILGILLNALDGIPECDFRMICMTTNRPDILDKAIKRPGRAEHFHFEKLTKKEIVKSCQKFWKKDFDLNEDEINDSKDNFFTSAELTRLNLNYSNDYQKVKNILQN